MTLPRLDAVANVLPSRGEQLESDAPTRGAPRPAALAPSLAPRKPVLVLNNASGLAVPPASAGIGLATARLRALQELADGLSKAMGSSWDDVRSVFDADIAAAQAEVEAHKA